MKKLPTNISDFEKLITEGYLYIDKTKDIYNLISQSENYFICRPRRFGKSLLVSTFECLFSGKKELFKDLWIYDKYNFKEYPVIKFDFSSIKASSANKLDKALMEIVTDLADQHNVDVSKFSDLNGKFKSLLEQLHKSRGPIVILIDEYDDPIVKNLRDLKLANEIRCVLIEFFKAIKSENKYLKFVFVTGITKFSKETIFSGMNNLFDLSLSVHGATLLGYTQQELEYFFKDYISIMAEKEVKSIENIKSDIKNWYNGYRFSVEDVRVYNPQSIINYFFEKRLENYWIETANKQLVLDIIKKDPNLLRTIDQELPDKEYLTMLELENIQLVPILFQTGYLTIKEFYYENPKTKEGIYYTIKTPNREIEKTLDRYLLIAYLNVDFGRSGTLLRQIYDAISQQNWDIFFNKIQELFANIPYQLHTQQESYYHSIMQIICSLMPFTATSEISTDKGRIDMVIETDNNIDLFEFKFNSEVEQALKQIEDRKYYQRYLALNKPITLVGASFIKSKNSFEIKWLAKKL